jgi:hypothetical protein
MLNKDELRLYLENLFDSHEHIWFGNRYASKKNAIPLSEALIKIPLMPPTHDGAFVALNPAREMGAELKKENIEAYRNILVEIDTIAGINEQTDFLKRSRVPFTSLVYTGNRSVHAVISLAEPLLMDPVFYRNVHKAICKKLAWVSDQATNGPQATTKLPGLFRINHTTQVATEQKLIELKPRVSYDRFLQSIERELHDILREEEIKIRRRSNHDFIYGNNDAISIIEPYCLQQNRPIPSERNINIRCPLCEQEGRDNKGNNLSVRIDGSMLLITCHRSPDHGYGKILNFLKKQGELK